MQLDDIRAHWQSWAHKYGTDLRATTKGTTAKIMEIDALTRAMREIAQERGDSLNILEAGCGNGKNCLSLLDVLEHAHFTGFDFIPEMIDAANAVRLELPRNSADRLKFQTGDVLAMDFPVASYDVVFTDRCLINLNTDELQQRAVASLAQLVKPGGYLLMIENSQATYSRQNLARQAVGLPPRTPDAFNRFIDENSLIPFLPNAGLELLVIEDFISLHDLALYILVPMLNGGKVDYAHPVVAAATQLNTALSAVAPNSIGAWGQNRLYKCRRKGQ